MWIISSTSISIYKGRKEMKEYVVCSINRIIPSDRALSKVAADSVHCS